MIALLVFGVPVTGLSIAMFAIMLREIVKARRMAALTGDPRAHRLPSMIYAFLLISPVGLFGGLTMLDYYFLGI